MTHVRLRNFACISFIIPPPPRLFFALLRMRFTQKRFPLKDLRTKEIFLHSFLIVVRSPRSMARLRVNNRQRIPQPAGLLEPTKFGRMRLPTIKKTRVGIRKRHEDVDLIWKRDRGFFAYKYLGSQDQSPANAILEVDPPNKISASSYQK